MVEVEANRDKKGALKETMEACKKRNKEKVKSSLARVAERKIRSCFPSLFSLG